jgi:molecular chaperone DnaK
MTIIGIDLGTTFSATSVVRDGKPHIIPISNQRILPSVVGVSGDNKWLVGTPALNQWTLYPERTVRSIKRKMGTDETILLGQEQKAYRPEQISALILQAIKQAAQHHLSEDVTQAVITVPAYFTDVQRRATRLAGEIAGLEVMRIINEPTAAALAYGMTTDSDEIALVYDLGGGTFDVSLVEMSGGIVDVRASHGNTQLGGDDFDHLLAQWLIEQFEDEHGIDLRGNRQAQARIQRAAEQAKIALSAEPYTWVREEYLAEKQGTPLHLEIEVSRAQFISLIEDLILKTLDSVDRVLEDSQIEKPDHVMLVGGSTYIPAVREMLTDHLGVSPRHDVNPSEGVALGAGIQGAIIEGAEIDTILVDVTPFSLGIAIAEFLPLGYVVDDRLKVLIPRNSTVPVTQKEVFSALHPQQTSAKIEVYQGERLIASENTLLGEFVFENLQPESVGDVAKVTVQFDLDINGILKVQAVDRGSQKAESITVRAEHTHMSQKDLRSQPLPDITHDMEATTISDDIRREAEVLLKRARQVDAKALKDEIDAVDMALNEDDTDGLRDALEDLSDALFDLEDPI